MSLPNVHFMGHPVLSVLPCYAIEDSIDQLSHVRVTGPARVLSVLTMISLTLGLGVASHQEQQWVEVVGEGHGETTYHQAGVVQEQSKH